MTTPEDLRAAINIKASLASNLITVALAFIGAEGGIGVFVLDKREHLAWFYLAAAAAVVALALSVCFGGSGIAKAYRDGFEGKWELRDQGRFNVQSILCLLGAGLVVISAMLGSAKTEVQWVDVHLAANEELRELRDQVEKLTRNQEKLEKNWDQLLSTRSQSTRRETAPRRNKNDHTIPRDSPQ